MQEVCLIQKLCLLVKSILKAVLTMDYEEFQMGNIYEWGGQLGH